MNSDLGYWLNLCTFQDNFLLLIAFIIKWKFRRILCKTPYDLVGVYLSSFITYYSSLSNIFPILAISRDLQLGLCFMCAYNTLYFMTSLTSLIIHLRFSLLWETLLTLNTVCFMLFLCAPLASYAFLFYNIYTLACVYPIYVSVFPLGWEVFLLLFFKYF